MKRRTFRGVTIVALGLAQIPLAAQDRPNPNLLKPFLGEDGRPIPRAQPVMPETPIPRAIPIEPRPAPPAQPEPPAPPPPKAIPTIEPEEPGTIRITPNAAPASADDVQLDLADSYYARKMYDMAAPEYERFLGLYPRSPSRPTALFRLAECYRIRGVNNAAKNSYETLLAQFRDNDFIAPASYRLAELYYQEKQYRDALPLYQKASVRLKEPTVANAAKFFTGRCLEAMGRKLEARLVYEDLVGTTKDNPFRDASQLSFALLLKDSARASDALKQIRALAKGAENPELKIEALVRSGLWALETDPPQSAQAETDFKAALALPGKSSWKELAQLGQMRLLAERNKPQEVVDTYVQLNGEVSADVKPQMLMLVASAQRTLEKVPDALATYDAVSTEFRGSVYDNEAQYERLRTMYGANDENLVAAIDKYLLANPEAQKRDEALLMKAEVLFKRRTTRARCRSTRRSSFPRR